MSTHNTRMIRYAQRTADKHPSNDQWKLRVDGVAAGCGIFKLVSLSNEAIAAGMTADSNILEVWIFGNSTTDPATNTRLAGNLFEISNDCGATWSTVELVDVIRNDGFKWFFRVKL